MVGPECLGRESDLEDDGAGLFGGGARGLSLRAGMGGWGHLEDDVAGLGGVALQELVHRKQGPRGRVPGLGVQGDRRNNAEGGTFANERDGGTAGRRNGRTAGRHG